jgi:hypothetical protein
MALPQRVFRVHRIDDVEADDAGDTADGQEPEVCIRPVDTKLVRRSQFGRRRRSPDG